MADKLYPGDTPDPAKRNPDLDTSLGVQGADVDEEAGAPEPPAASAPGERKPHHDPEERQEKLLEEGLEETFPASDPVSVKRIT